MRAPHDLDRAEEFFAAAGCRTQRRREGFVHGIGGAVRVEDPLGFTVEFFHDTTHAERLFWRYDLHPPTPLARLDHCNVVVPDVPAGCDFLRNRASG